VKWRANGRYQVNQPTTVQTLDGRQVVLPLGLAQVMPMDRGIRINVSKDRSGMTLVLSDQAIDQLVQEGTMRKL